MSSSCTSTSNHMALCMHCAYNPKIKDNKTLKKLMQALEDETFPCFGPTLSNLQIPCNPYQNCNDILHRKKKFT